MLLAPTAEFIVNARSILRLMGNVAFRWAG